MRNNATDLQLRYELLFEREKQLRADINEMRRELTRISRERKAAYKAWRDALNGK